MSNPTRGLRRRRVRSFRRGMKSRRQVLFVAAVKLYGSPENAAGRPTTLPAPTTRVGYKWEEELTRVVSDYDHQRQHPRDLSRGCYILPGRKLAFL
jgi:hypothetical protein